MKPRSLRIGITIGLRNPGESLWLNGIKQNALYLAKMFKNSVHKHWVVILNTTDVPVDDRIPWDRSVFETKSFDEETERLDILIELGGQIDWNQTARLKQSGTKIISYCCGAEYIQTMEAIIFRRKLYDGIYINPSYDAVWLIPQLWELNRGFFETLRRCPVRQVPFVWDPMTLEMATGDLLHSGEYRPHGGAKRLSVCEPNVDVVKFCLYPIFIIEQVFRRNPELVHFLHVTNASSFVHDNREFVGLMQHLEIVKAGKAAFIDRVTTPFFLADHTDIVVSHQWDLPLNYLYLECCWQGFPLVHNAELIRDLGYYYPGHDLKGGVEVLGDVLKSHDTRWQEYIAMQRSRMSRFLATDPGLCAQYDDLLFELIDREPT